LIRWRGWRILLDPYLSDSLTTKYAATDKPHVRMTERVIAPERLRGIHLVTCSHNHTDHLDAETLIPLRKANADFLLLHPSANGEFIRQRLGWAMEPAVGIDHHEIYLCDRGTLAYAYSRSDAPGNAPMITRDEYNDSRVVIHGIAAAHNDLEHDEQGRARFLGYVLHLGRKWTIYHSGDTLRYPGLAETLEEQATIDLALLPINGNKPERRVAGNLDGREAAQLAHEIGAKLVVPCHYEMFEFNTADPRELFVPECERLGQAYRVLQAGESLTLA
jgi:L-ascorbate metabolism protein UlaG (beta-lactamase superfamily)